MVGHVIKALWHRHYTNVRHRDVAFANLLFNDRGKLTLIVFDFAAQSSGRLLREARGSVPSVAPEVLQGDAVGYEGIAADIWSLGVLVLELARGLYAVVELVCLRLR